MKFRVAALALLALSAPAQAKWYEASSEHFVIYADDKESDIRKFSENLERYHSALKFLSGRDIETPSPSNRVVIFAVGGQGDMRKLTGGSNSIAGFYVPRAGASRAFVQDISNKSGYPSFSTVVLLHEYAHHFLISSSRHAMPRWLSEGSAEFFAAASFNKDGSVQIGRPALHRANELAYADDVGIDELLDSDLYEKRKGKRYDAFYGRSWLLFHYLTFAAERQGQLNDYWHRVSSGEPSIEAAQAAFGNIDVLQKELDGYLRQRRMLNFRLAPEKITIGPVTLRELPEGEAAMMDVRIRSQRGVDREEATALVVEARKIAKRFPNDAGVLTALAEAEFDAGNDDAAIAAAEKAIAIDPNQSNAYVQKGYALFRKAQAAEPDAANAAYAEAMRPFSALNKLEPDHPLPLVYFYRSFVEQGKEPNENARHALEWASQLAPFDKGLALNTAIMQAKEGKIELARLTLQPLVADPHAGKEAEVARKITEALADAVDGKPWTGSAPNVEVEISEEAADGDPSAD